MVPEWAKDGNVSSSRCSRLTCSCTVERDQSLICELSLSSITHTHKSEQATLFRVGLWCSTLAPVGHVRDERQWVSFPHRP